MEYTYQAAKHLGERCWKEKTARREDPYLPVLEDLLAGKGALAEQPLGLEEIPIAQIAGTLSDGRRQAFAANFMPLMDEASEFAAKYRTLISAHENEGIRDPVKAYEYMHRYYIAEGNKRVSVLKLFGAVTVPGDVIRILPPRSEEPAVRVYYEFLHFYEIVPVSFLVFSKPGDYERFLTLTGWSREKLPTEKDLRQLRSAYFRFEAAFRAMEGSRFRELTASDAFLIYLEIFGWEKMRDSLPDSIRKDLVRIRDEFELRTSGESVKLVTDAAEEKRQSLLERIFTPDRVLKIAFLYEETPETLSWTYGHELGRRHAAEVFGEKIVTKVYENTDEENASEKIREAVEDGADVIFAASSRFLNACLKAAVTWPEVKILCCALYYPHRYLRSYYARIYEAKFVSGAVAGAMAGASDIGYVATCPYLANILNLNAFANGVRMTNPRARVHAVWTDEIGADPRVTFWNEGISIISGRELLAPAEEFHREFGLYRFTEEHEVENLAMTLWNWGEIYRRLIESIRNGGWEDVEKKSGPRALNYFWGLDSGAIELQISESVPEGVAYLARQLAAGIKNGTVSPFYGTEAPGADRAELSLRGPAVLKALKERGWLPENAVGHIPGVEALRPQVRPLALTQGIESLKGKLASSEEDGRA
jgi:basic membrane lipoprotein Med (substrate-binding protein (PBP1-ABC) superfamily)